MTRRYSLFLLLPILVLVAALQLRADRSSSLTFDEVVLIGEGVRGIEVGAWGMVVEQPPVMPTLYGMAAASAVDALPDEASAEWGFQTRWRWARELLFAVGNDPRAVASAARSVGMVMTTLLLLLVWWFGMRIAGPAAGLLAAALTGLHPEVITHGAIAYNDLPLALAFLAVIATGERAVRDPRVTTGALVGAALAFALGVKYSALAALPVLGVLLAAGVVAGPRETARMRKLGAVVAAAAVTFWGATALIWGGDFGLVGIGGGLALTVERALVGHPAPAWLFGATSQEGFRAFFPVAWLVKTPIALQVATLVGVGLLIRGGIRGAHRAGHAVPAERTDPAGGNRLARLCASPLRGPVIGVVVFGAFLMASSQNVGFRYALPLVPLLALLAGAGWVGRAPDGGEPPMTTGRGSYRDGRRLLRAGLPAVLVAATALTVIRSGPILLSFEAGWTAVREGPPALLDSSVDWGQGLLALRDWMTANEVPAVRLSYFGSALPEGYGIEYAPLPSFLPLRGTPTGGVTEVPEWTAISRTNLYGLYFQGADPFAEYRARAPDAIIGGSILLFHEGGDTAP